MSTFVKKKEMEHLIPNVERQKSTAFVFFKHLWMIDTIFFQLTVDNLHNILLIYFTLGLDWQFKVKILLFTICFTQIYLYIYTLHTTLKKYLQKYCTNNTFYYHHQSTNLMEFLTCWDSRCFPFQNDQTRAETMHETRLQV